MEDRIYKVDLYLYDRPLIINPIEFYQNDTESCAIEFNFNTDRVNKFDLTNKTVEIRVTKPDLTVITDSATITGLNTAVWELKLGAISVAGSCSISIYVYKNVERLTFGTLKYKVIADREVTNVISQPEYPLLTKLISDVQGALNESNQVNENISVMELERVGNENTRKTSEQQRVTNEDTRNLAEQQRQQNETTRNSEFNNIKSEYSGIKGIMLDTNNAANLQNQVNQVNTQLAEKATKGDITASDLKIQNESDRLGLENLKEEVIQAMAGNTPVNSIPADKSVTPSKTSFITTGKNLFNKNTANLGYYVYEINGTLAASASYNASDYIPVSPSTNYTFISPSGGTRIAYYDINKTFISGVVGPTMPITTPANSRYVRFSFSTTLAVDAQQFELGNVATAYEPFKQILSLDNFSLDNVKVNEVSLEDSSVSESKLKPKSVGLAKLSDEIANMLTEFNNLSVSPIDGYRHIDRNEINVANPYKYVIVNCNVNEIYKVTASISGSATAVIVFTDANGDKISHLLAGTASVVTYTDYEFVVPNGVTKMYITFLSTYPLQLSKKGFVDLSAVRKPYEGKKWICVGDSLTAENSATTKHYFDYISEELGFSVVNMGVSGSGYKQQEGNSNAFYQRISNVPTDADIVTIFGSGNDEALTLGAPTDTTTDTVCGCINKALDNYYTKCPTTPIGLITPTPWEYRPPHNAGNTMDLISNAIVEIGKRRSVPVLDLYHSSGLRPWDATFKTLAYSKDNGGGVHPDETGHEIIASKIREFVKSLI